MYCKFNGWTGFGIPGLPGILFQKKKITRMMIRDLEPGTELRLYREPDHIHDKRAVKVVTQDDVEPGYLCRFKNKTVARLIDEGKKFVACVDGESEKPNDSDERNRTRAPTEDYRMPVAVYISNQYQSNLKHNKK